MCQSIVIPKWEVHIISNQSRLVKLNSALAPHTSNSSQGVLEGAAPFKHALIVRISIALQ